MAVSVKPPWRLLGAAGFLWLDIAALSAACRATGHHLGALALAVAYFIGYVAAMIPMAAGLAVLDPGLAGAMSPPRLMVCCAIPSTGPAQRSMRWP